MYKLGIDVGGTNIDFAVVDKEDNLLYGHKILAGIVPAGIVHNHPAPCQTPDSRAARFPFQTVRALARYSAGVILTKRLNVWQK